MVISVVGCCRRSSACLMQLLGGGAKASQTEPSQTSYEEARECICGGGGDDTKKALRELKTHSGASLQQSLSTTCSLAWLQFFEARRIPAAARTRHLPSPVCSIGSARARIGAPWASCGPSRWAHTGAHNTRPGTGYRAGLAHSLMTVRLCQTSTESTAAPTRSNEGRFCPNLTRNFS